MAVKKLVSLILLVVVTSLILTTMTDIFNEAEGSYSESACRASVLLRGQASVDAQYVEAERFTPLACSSKDLGRLEGSVEKQRKTIADHAATCWWMFAEGKIPNIFDKEGGEKGCHICYRFRPGPAVGEKMSGENLTSYLENTTFNPSALRGGGSDYFIGDGIKLNTLNLETEPQSYVNLADIDAPDTATAVSDASKILSSDQRSDITGAIGDLASEKDLRGYVVVAGDIRNHNRDAAQKAMKDLKLTDNESRGFLITVNLNDSEVRLDAGKALNTYISEVEIRGMLQPLQQARGRADVARGIVDVVEKIGNQVVDGDKRAYDPSSYYGYMVNEQKSFPLIARDIHSDKTYVIAYMATSDYLSYMRGWGALVMENADALGAGAATGGAATLALIGGPYTATIAGGVKLIAAAGTAGSVAAADKEDYKTFSNAFFGNVKGGSYQNNILIAPNDKVVNQCND